MTYIQLKNLVTINNVNRQKTPTAKQLSGSGVQPVHQWRCGNFSFTLYANGYIVCCATYNAEWKTVFSLDKVAREHKIGNLDVEPFIFLMADSRIWHNMEVYEMKLKTRLSNSAKNSLSVVPDFSDEVNRELDLKRAKKLLKEALASLTEKQRQVIVMRFYDEMSQQEIANALGVGRTAVEGCIHRALKNMREYIEKFV